MKTFRLLFLILSYALAGCAHDSGKGIDNSGVAAVVNGVEITSREVDYFYRRAAAPGMSDKESANLKRRILADLVRTELLAGKGHEMRLDKSPDYSLALYASQKNVLAGLTENQLVEAGASEVSAGQAQNVVQNNPNLFAGRKLFVYDEVMIASGDVPLLESLDVMVQKGATLSQLLDVLKAKKILFKKTVKALPSEKIPPPVLTIFQSIKPDVPQVVNTKSKVSLLLVLHDAIPAPLEGESAIRAAKSMIMAQRKGQALSKAMGSLVDGAKITYYGDYAKPVNDKKAPDVLPVPDHSRVTKKLYKALTLGGILAGSFVLTILALTALMRTLYSKAWLPKLWPLWGAKKMERPYESARHRVPLSYRFYLFVMAILIAGALGVEVVVLWGMLPLWGLFAGVVGGALVGVLASRVYQYGFLSASSRKGYSLLVGILTAPILVSALVILRLSAFYH